MSREPPSRATAALTALQQAAVAYATAKRCLAAGQLTKQQVQQARIALEAAAERSPPRYRARDPSAARNLATASWVWCGTPASQRPWPSGHS